MAELLFGFFRSDFMFFECLAKCFFNILYRVVDFRFPDDGTSGRISRYNLFFGYISVLEQTVKIGSIFSRTWMNRIQQPGLRQ